MQMYHSVLVLEICVEENIILLIYCNMNTYQSVTLASVDFPLLH